jgi:sugar-phosphatase
MITGDDVVNGKPDPSSYQKGAALLGLAPKDCLVVEDAPAGVASGKAAGCQVLAAANRKEWPMLMDADYRVESLEVISADVKNGEIRLRY